MEITKAQINLLKSLVFQTRSAVTAIKSLPMNFTPREPFRELALNLYNRTSSFVTANPSFYDAFTIVPSNMGQTTPLQSESELAILRIFLDDIENIILDELDTGKVASNEYVIPMDKPLTANNVVTQILKQSKESIKIVDNYLSKETAELLESAVNSSRDVYILTSESNQKKLNDFLASIKILRRTWKGKLEIKSTKDFHDRYIIVDNNDVWYSGPSLDLLGTKKHGVIGKLRDNGLSIITLFDESWKTAKELDPTSVSV